MTYIFELILIILLIFYYNDVFYKVYLYAYIYIQGYHLYANEFENAYNSIYIDLSTYIFYDNAHSGYIVIILVLYKNKGTIDMLRKRSSLAHFAYGGIPLN